MSLTRREALQLMGGGVAALTGFTSGCASLPRKDDEKLSLKNPSDFTRHYATAIIGADTLAGGNIGVPSGRDHFIADQWTSGEPLPEVYDDDAAKELRSKGGAGEAKEAAVQLIKRYDLLDVPTEASRIAKREFDSGRAGYIERTMECMRLMIQYSLAVATGDMTQAPSFEERYRAAIGEYPELEDPKKTMEILRASLAAEGEDVSRSKSLAEALEERNKTRYLPREQVASEIPKIMQQLLELTRQNILSRVNIQAPGHDSHLSNVSFGGQKIDLIDKVHFTASSAYHGGEDSSGAEKLGALLEYNVDIPITREYLISLLAHESMPGHYFQSCVIDLLRRGGKLGWESSVATMCTGETTFHEGWANAALEMVCGGSQEAVINRFGPDFRVIYAADELESTAKNNVGILFQRDGVTLEKLKQMLEAEYALSPAYVNKLSGAWAQDPLMGPMYAPAYLKGTQTIRGALARYGLDRVVKAGLHSRGLVDDQRFKDEVKRAA